MAVDIHKAESRGYADHGWLKTSHTFSFAGYHDPERVRFGLLRVLNDDIVQPAKGFGTHSHENMEIISIPLTGTLAHNDSYGHEKAIYSNDVQMMSTGTGITHSEFNHSEKDPVNFLQIWIFPKEKNITPRYDQKTFDPKASINNWQFYVTPEKNEDTLWINQNAYLARTRLTAGTEITYTIQEKENGMYLFVISGEVILDGSLLNRRDGAAVTGMQNIKLVVENDADLLAIEVRV